MTEGAALGLAIGTLGCTPDPGFTLDDEAGSETASDDPSGDGDGDPTVGDGDGDTGPNDIPFELVLGRLNATGKFVALRFTEPVGPVDGIDPSDFRISYARLTGFCYYNDCTDQTTYWDPNFYAHNYIPYQPYSYDRFEVDMVTAGMQPTDVFLRFAVPLDPILCEYNYIYGAEYDALFVHYSPGAIPLTSSDGESLAGIGTQWVEQSSQPVWAVNGQFPDLVPKIAIPCTLVSP